MKELDPMSFDKFVNIVAPSKHNLSTKTIIKGNYIEKEFNYVYKSKILFVMAPPWHASKLSTWVIRDKLKRLDYSYLSYFVHPDILNPDYKNSKKYILNLIDVMVKDIDHYSRKYKFNEVHIAGFSIGSLYATIVANRCKQVNKVVLVTIGAPLGDILYDSICTMDIKKIFIKNKVTTRELNRYWKEINPENNINNLKGKEIRIVISTSDQVIKYKYAFRFIKKLEKEGISPIIIKNKNQGHYGTIIHFLLNPKKYL
jgi:hypothetical protein